MPSLVVQSQLPDWCLWARTENTSYNLLKSKCTEHYRFITMAHATKSHIQTGEPSFGPILVFGGCGYLGCHIVEALHADGKFSSIVAASRNPTRFCIEDASYEICDITNRAQVEKLLDEARPQVIIHSVAPNSNAPEEIQYKVNYLATKTLLECARSHTTVQALVYTSSARAIFNMSDTLSEPLTEEKAILHNLTSGGAPYERTKGATDALVQAMNTGDDRESPFSGLSTQSDFQGLLLTTVIRVPALYGRRDLRTSGEILKRLNTSATRVQLGNNTLWSMV